MLPPTTMAAPRDPRSPLRVLHVFGAMNRGGAELRTLEVMAQLDPAQVRLEFCALSGQAGTLDAEIARRGGAVHPCRLDAGFPLRFAALVRRQQITVVHSHVQLASGFILAVAAAAGVRQRIAHFRSTGDDRGDGWPRRGYRRAMRVLLDQAATAIVACAEGVMTAAWSPSWRADPRCQIVYNGVDETAFDRPDERAAVRAELGLAADAPLVLQVGRFDPPKNHARAVDVLAALPRADVHLAYAGRLGTPDEAATRARVAATGLGDRVHFLGERSDVPRLRAAVDLVLMTSVREGLPGSVLEAVAAGTPTVASDLPGVREIAARLPGIEVCALTEPDRRWAAAVERGLATPPTSASRAAARARLRASTFSIAAATAAHLALWAPPR